MLASETIFVTGHRGLVGSALCRILSEFHHKKLITKSRSELDLLNQNAVQTFFSTNQIDTVILAAGKVGGIIANQNAQADFIYENLVIASNVIGAAAQFNVKKLLYLGSSCVYPKLAPQPIKEQSLLSSSLEPTNEGYAIAKIAGLKLCEMFRRQYGKNFLAAMPTNLYGPGDNFHPTSSHVIPGMLRRFHEAKLKGASTVTIWGSGKPLREFMHVDDLARACLLLLESHRHDGNLINLGSGQEITILELALLIKEVVGFEGTVLTDPSKPDGTPRKRLDTTRLDALGFKPSISLEEGLKSTYAWAVSNKIFEKGSARAGTEQATFEPKHINS